LFAKATHCGSIWSDNECLREKKDEVQLFWLEFMCEYQQLKTPVGSDVFVDSAEIDGCVNDRFVDTCDLLNEIKT
jgi:hypothetical protein